MLTMPKAPKVAGDGACPLRDEEWDTISRHLKLSPRELQIVQRVLDDDKEQAIARRLEISAHTVHTHLRHIYWKLGVSSRLELVVRVFREYVVLSRQELSPKSSRAASCLRPKAGIGR